MPDSPARTPPSARRPRSGSRSRGSRGSRPSSARSARSGASGKSDGDGLDDNVLAMLNIERTSSRNASRERDANNPRRADAAAGGEERSRRPIAPSFDSTGSGGLDYENLVDDEATLDSKGGARRESLKNALRRTSASGRGGRRASAGAAGGDDASAAEVAQEGSTESQWLRDEAARRALEEERRRAFTPRGTYDAAGAQDLDESANILSDSWDAASAERRASAHASSVTERAHMLAHALTFSRSPPGGTVSRRLEGLGPVWKPTTGLGGPDQT